MEDRCVCCGEIIPEGIIVCPNCEERGNDMTKHDASEQAYKNGYSAGYEAGRRSVGRKSGRCDMCRGRAYTDKPFKVVTQLERVVEVQFNYCPVCGADMRGEEDA
jgi:RNA polymerase subunit RPABC4/transcription elongation factor Spt4